MIVNARAVRIKEIEQTIAATKAAEEKMIKQAEELKNDKKEKEIKVDEQEEGLNTSRESIAEISMFNPQTPSGRFALGAVLLSAAAGIGYFVLRRTKLQN